MVLAEQGLTGLIGVEFAITVGVSSGNVPIAARFSCDSVPTAISLSTCHYLLGHGVFDVIVDEGISEINWFDKTINWQGMSQRRCRGRQ